MARITLCHPDCLADPARDQRDFHDIGVHRGDGEQAAETVLDRLLSTWMLADYDDVGVGAVAQEAGNCGLCEHQEVVAIGELRKEVLPKAEDAKATRGIDRRLPVMHRATLIAEQHEM